MKKTLIFLAIIALVSPQIALASWWNPVSWFDREENSSMELDFSTTTNARIIHDTADVRENKNITEPTVDPKRNSSGKDAALLAIAEKEIEVLKETILRLQKEISQLKGLKPYVKEVVKEVAVEKVEYRDRVVERPIEKVVYKDRVVEKLVNVFTSAPAVAVATEPASLSASVSPSNSVVIYSDYNFNPHWNLERGQYVLSCSMTPRNIVIRKAAFKIPDSTLQKIINLRSLEADGFKVDTNTLSVIESHFGSRSQSYSLEEVTPNKFVYFGGDIPICSDGRTVTISPSIAGSIMDISQGRNVKIYLEQKGIIIDATSIGNGVMFDLHELPVPIMTEWEVWDNTSNKPVKVM